MFLDEARAALARVRAPTTSAGPSPGARPDQLAVGYALDLGPRLLRVLPQLEAELPQLDVALRGLADRAPARRDRPPHAARRRVLGRRGVAGRCTLVVDEAPFVSRGAAGHPFAGARPSTWPRSPASRSSASPAIHPRLYDRLAAALDGTGRPWSLVGTAVGIVDVAARVLTGQGVGIVFAPEAAARPLDGVVAVPIADGPAVERTLVWRRDERRPAVPRFVALAQAELARVGAGPAPQARRPPSTTRAWPVM